MDDNTLSVISNGWTSGWIVDENDLVLVLVGHDPAADAIKPFKPRHYSFRDILSERKQRHILDLLLKRVRRDKRLVEIPLHWPDGRNGEMIYLLRLQPINTRGWVLCQHRPLACSLQQEAVSKKADSPRLCAWCHRVRTPQGWLELEQAVREHQLLRREVGDLTHGLCDSCNRTMIHQTPTTPLSRQASLADQLS